MHSVGHCAFLRLIHLLRENTEETCLKEFQYNFDDCVLSNSSKCRLDFAKKKKQPACGSNSFFTPSASACVLDAEASCECFRRLCTAAHQFIMSGRRSSSSSSESLAVRDDCNFPFECRRSHKACGASGKREQQIEPP